MRANTVSNLAVDLDNVLINAESTVTVSGSVDFTLQAGDCFKIMYDQPYKLSKETYETQRALLPDPDSFPDFYVPFPSDKSVSVASSTFGATIQSQEDLYIMLDVGS